MKERREGFLTYLNLRDTPLSERILHWLAGSGKYPFGDLSTWYAAELIGSPRTSSWGEVFMVDVVGKAGCVQAAERGVECSPLSEYKAEMVT